MQTETPRKSLGRRIYENPWAPFVLPVVAGVLLGVSIMLPWPKPETTSPNPARDQAAVERAQAWLEQLGFEPGPAVCRTVRGGSGWCTVRVAGTDRTYSLFCSYRHPTCVESVATFEW